MGIAAAVGRRSENAQVSVRAVAAAVKKDAVKNDEKDRWESGLLIKTLCPPLPAEGILQRSR